MKEVLQLIIISSFFFNVACSLQVESPVSKVNKNEKKQESPKLESEEHLSLISLAFEGRDPFGAKCNFYLSLLEYEEEENNNHGHELVVQLDYVLHGERPLDTKANFYMYSLNDNQFFDIETDTEGTSPVLLSIVLDDEGENESIDPNQLGEYEQEGHLSQSLRVDFLDMNVEVFEETLEEALEDNYISETGFKVLDQMSRVVVKTNHNGHYDSVACSGFKLVGLQEVDFELGTEYDDHDGEHEHDDEHDD